MFLLKLKKVKIDSWFKVRHLISGMTSRLSDRLVANVLYLIFTTDDEGKLGKIMETARLNHGDMAILCKSFS